MQDAVQPNALPLLFQPMTLRGVTTKNRIVVSPMCQYLSRDGAPTDWHLVHLGKFAMGGAGVVFFEDTAIEANGRKTYGCAGMYHDNQVVPYRRITDFVKSQGALPAIQLGHAGRKAAVRAPWEGMMPLNDEDARQGRASWRGISSSPLAMSDAAPAPHALSRAEIMKHVKAWGDAARRSRDAGFEVCEVHGAHGYLIQQFLSPAVNRRRDAYGGDIQGRMRFALEIVEEVRRAWPADRPLFFRVSAIDGPGGAWQIEDTLVLARELKARGVDVIDCSSGGINGPVTMGRGPRRPGYQVPYAEQIRAGAALATMAVGLIMEPQQAEGILQAGQADLIALARELMLDPNWPVRAAKILGHPDPLSLLPIDYAWWLRQREAGLAQLREQDDGRSQ
jgi:2,4-dienoyl-CoA reductase-like NADH-dependent reductase (Old Yellow Enzyme family)